MLLLSLAAIGRMRRGVWPKRFLHVAQVETDQSVGEKNGWDAAGAPKPVNGRFANLQDFRELTRGQILRSLVPGLFRRIGFAGFRV